MGSVRRTTYHRYLLFLGLNVIVSAITVLIVLAIWDRRGQAQPQSPTPTIDVAAQVASAIPTKTPTTPASATPVTYMIRGGDTLSDIAVKLGVSMDALMQANGIKDPNALSAGQVLIVPVDAVPGGISPPAEKTPSVAQETSMPSPVPSTAQVLINGVEDAGNIEGESIRLLNSGGEVSMAEWTLDDGEGHVYPFPAFTFYTTGAVYVHTGSGSDTSIDLYWGLEEAILLPGKVITLRDASGGIQDSFKIPEN
jgi:LysM repeat protein